MKPIITVYSGESPEETKKFEGFITAAFWIGFDHTEGEVASVRVRQPNVSYDQDVAELSEFTALLVERQINFSVEFFTEPTPDLSVESPVPEPIKESRPPEAKGQFDYETEITKLKEEYQKGTMTKNQYETKKNALLKKWKDKVEGTLRN